MTWGEIQTMGALAAEGEARGVADLHKDVELAALAKPIMNAALRRFVLRQKVERAAPALGNFGSLRGFREYTIRAALWLGDEHARRFFVGLDLLTDAEIGDLWEDIAAVAEGREVPGASDSIARKVRFGIHRATWQLISAVVAANHDHERGGPQPDYQHLLAPLLRNRPARP